MMKKKMLAVAVCVSMCMMAFAGCTSESGGGSDKKAEQTEGKKEESGKVFMTVSNQQNEFMVGMAENFKEPLDDYHFDRDHYDSCNLYICIPWFYVGSIRRCRSITSSGSQSR